MIITVCDNPDVLSVLRLVKIVVTIIRIIVPIILIVSLSINYLNAVHNNDSDALHKANKGAVIKVIATILVFLLPTFVKLIMNIASYNSTNYTACMDYATEDGIKNARISQANNLIDQFKNTLTRNDYNNAINYVNKIKDGTEKRELEEELNNYKKYVEIQELINTLKIKPNKNDRKKLSQLIDNLSDDDPYKEKFTNLLKELGLGVPLDVPEGYQEFYWGNLKYYIHFPKDATTNMPLLLWLHGDNFIELWAKNTRISSYSYEAGYPTIVLLPFVGPGMGTETKGWYEGGLLPTVKELTDYVIEKYECDKDNINIGGHSRGAIGTWMMVSQYPNFFHAASPISCCSFYGMKPENYKGVKVWAFRGSNAGKGSNNDNIYGGCMQSDVNAVKPYAKEVRYTILPNTTHGDATNHLSDNKEWYEFMFGD